jgi:hypothetical protein
MKVIGRVMAAVVFVSGCGGPPQQQQSAETNDPRGTPSLEPTALTLPAPSGASQPQLTASARGSLLSWVEQTGASATLRFAERGATAWTEPKTIVSGSDWFLSDADAPTVQRLADGTLVAAWYRSTNAQLEAYDTWLAYSKDDGKTWSRPFKPYTDKTTTQHGFVSMFDQPGGGLGLVWLDAREWELNQDAPDGGSVMLRSASFDTSWKQTSDQLANLRVCDCCQTSVATTPDGVVTAFRDRTDREIRDIHVIRLERGKWTDAQPVHHDNWEIDSCPVNGPAISANGRSLVVAWFTAAAGQAHSYAAFSPDAGRTWGDPIRLDEQASTGRVDVEMLDDGTAVATWVEFANQQARFKARRISASAPPSAPVAVSSGRANGFPRMTRQGDELLFVWTEGGGEDGGTVQTKGAVARVR